MANLTEKRFNFNSKLRIDHTGGELSTDADLVSVKELMVAFDFTILAEQLVCFNEDWHYFKHTNVSLLE